MRWLLALLITTTAMPAMAMAVEGVRPPPRPEPLVEYTNDFGDTAFLFCRAASPGEQADTDGQCPYGLRLVAKFADLLENGDLYVREDERADLPDITVDVEGEATLYYSDGIVAAQTEAKYREPVFVTEKTLGLRGAAVLEVLAE